jgi:hypothetical protein
MVIDQLQVVNGENATLRICPNHDAGFPSDLDYAPVCLNGAAIEDNEPAVLLAMREPIIGQLSKPCRAFVAGTRARTCRTLRIQVSWRPCCWKWRADHHSPTIGVAGCSPKPATLFTRMRARS